MSSAFVARLKEFIEVENRMNRIDALRKTQPRIPCLGDNCTNTVDSKHSVSMCDKCRDEACDMNGGTMQRFCQAMLPELPVQRCKGTVRKGSWFCSRHQSAAMFPHDKAEAEEMARGLIAATKKRRKEHDEAVKRAKKAAKTATAVATTSAAEKVSIDETKEEK